jgi:hypothetical protein
MKGIRTPNPPCISKQQIESVHQTTTKEDKYHVSIVEVMKGRGLVVERVLMRKIEAV